MPTHDVDCCTNANFLPVSLGLNTSVLLTCSSIVYPGVKLAFILVCFKLLAIITDKSNIESILRILGLEGIEFNKLL